MFRLDTAVTTQADRRFLLTNEDDYSMAYDGLVMAVEKRRSGRLAGVRLVHLVEGVRVDGIQRDLGGGRAVEHGLTPQPSTFGEIQRLTNARGRLPNDRPHIARVMGSVDVPRTGLVLAGNLQQFSGTPWFAAAGRAAPGAATHPARAARFTATVVTDPARYASVVGCTARWPWTNRTAAGRA